MDIQVVLLGEFDRNGQENAVAYAVDAALEKERAKTEAERIKASKLLEEERAKVERAEVEKRATARSIKELGVLTNQQIAEKFNLPIDVVEEL